jgi:light-regulated signal transduction histidine kinase (bacteriophytochrome)
LKLQKYPEKTAMTVTNEVNMLFEAIYGMVLLTINLSQLQFQTMDLGQELRPYCSGVLEIPLAPHLALPLFWFKQPTLQQTAQWARKCPCHYLSQKRNKKETDTSNPALLSKRNEAQIA